VQYDPNTRRSPLIATVNGNVYLFGGIAPDDGWSSYLYVFLPETYSWKLLGGYQSSEAIVTSNCSYSWPGSRIEGIAWGDGTYLWITAGRGSVNFGNVLL
jgi:hypothetical protein